MLIGNTVVIILTGLLVLLNGLCDRAVQVDDAQDHHQRPAARSQVISGGYAIHAGGPDDGLPGGWIGQSDITIIPDKPPAIRVHATPRIAPVPSWSPATPPFAVAADESLAGIGLVGEGSEFGLPSTPTLIDLAPIRSFSMSDQPMKSPTVPQPDRAMMICGFEPPLPPRKARRSGLQSGLASVRITLDAEGRLTDLETVSEEPPDFDLAAALKESLRSCHYTSPIVDGKKVPMKVVVTYDFTPNTPLTVRTSGNVEMIVR
jgi:hypothetical protein